MPAFDQLTLTTKRLLLRPLRDSDACELLGIFSDPKVMRYWSAPPWESIKQAKSMIDRDIKAMAARESVRFGLERTEDGMLIGTCTLFAISEQCRRAEVCIGVARLG